MCLHLCKNLHIFSFAHLHKKSSTFNVKSPKFYVKMQLERRNRHWSFSALSPHGLIEIVGKLFVCANFVPGITSTHRNHLKRLSGGMERFLSPPEPLAARRSPQTVTILRPKRRRDFHHFRDDDLKHSKFDLHQDKLRTEMQLFSVCDTTADCWSAASIHVSPLQKAPARPV